MLTSQLTPNLGRRRLPDEESLLATLGTAMRNDVQELGRKTV